MAKGVKVTFNPKDFDAFRNSSEMQALLSELGEQVKDRANAYGSGKYEVDTKPGKKRASTRVKTTDAKSRASNAKHNSLLKALLGGGGS